MLIKTMKAEETVTARRTQRIMTTKQCGIQDGILGQKTNQGKTKTVRIKDVP